MLHCGIKLRQGAESLPKGLRQYAPPDSIVPMKVQRLVAAVFVFASASAAARDLSLVEAERLLGERGREVIAARRALASAGAHRIIAAARPNATLPLNSSCITSTPGTGSGPRNHT